MALLNKPFLFITFSLCCVWCNQVFVLFSEWFACCTDYDTPVLYVLQYIFQFLTLSRMKVHFESKLSSFMSVFYLSPLTVCSDRGLADGHVYLWLLSNRYWWEFGFPWKIQVGQPQTSSHKICSLFWTKCKIIVCLVSSGGMLSSSPTLPLNEAKPQ